MVTGDFNGLLIGRNDRNSLQFKLNNVYERILPSRMFIRHYKHSLQIYNSFPQLQNKKST